MDERQPAFQRILLKVSGEMLAGADKFGIRSSVLSRVAGEVAEIAAMGVELALVVGGGNFFRGVAGAASGMDRPSADNIGMLATMINALALEDALRSRGCPVVTLSALGLQTLAEPFTRRGALRHLAAGKVVIFGGGTGSPFFSTDTASALRAGEIGANVVLKGTRVRGVFDSDPERNPAAVFYPRLDHARAIREGLRVMDSTALSLCLENDIPIVVFDMTVPGNLARVVRGEDLGTWVGSAARPGG